MYTRILVPLDGSDLSLQALPYARLIAQRTGAYLDLLQVVPSAFDVSGPALGNPQLSDELRQKAAAWLEDRAAELRAQGIETRTSAVQGSPAGAIFGEAGRFDGTLIAMTTHGRSGLSRWWLGSVTDRVVRETDSPVLVVRAKDPSEVPDDDSVFDTIVLTLDGSEVAERAIPHARELAKALALKVVLLRVVDALGGYLEAPVYLGSVDEMRDEALAYLRTIGDRFREAGVASVEERVEVGYPALVILDTLPTLGRPLAVMATHGRSGPMRLLIGSVTDRVIRNCGVPVLVVPTPL